MLMIMAYAICSSERKNTLYSCFIASHGFELQALKISTLQVHLPQALSRRRHGDLNAVETSMNKELSLGQPSSGRRSGVGCLAVV
jgi:hypothetical protein